MRRQRNTNLLIIHFLLYKSIKDNAQTQKIQIRDIFQVLFPSNHFIRLFSSSHKFKGYYLALNMITVSGH